MEEYVAFVLKSLSSDKHFVGYTTNLISRFKSYNSLGKKGYTNRYKPWQVIHVEFFHMKKNGMAREIFF